MTSALATQWLVTAIGWAILHSLWQGAAIGVATALALRALARNSAASRYVVACVGLAAIAVAWVATASMHAGTASTARDVFSTTAPGIGRAVAVAQPTVVAPIASSSVLRTAATTPWHPALESWSIVVVAIWLLGVCVMALRLGVAWYRILCLRHAVQSIADGMRDRIDVLRARIHVSRPVRIAQSAAVRVPTVIGALRPVILLPVSALAGLSPDQLDAILAHELAHVRRHDYAVNIVQSAIEVVLFYHPACWWLSRQIRHERELCCDDIAVDVCGDRVAYAEALTDMEALRANEPSLSLAATGPVRRRCSAKADGPLLRRVRRLVKAPAAIGGSAPSWAAAALPLVVLSVAVMSAQTRVPSAPRVVPADAGIVQGRVTDADSAQPITGARVQLLGPGGEIDAMTDADGHYEATAVRPGDYRVNASSDGYATADYRQTNTGNEPGLPLAVAGGHVVENIDFSLHPAAVVTGRITDQQEMPMARVEIELLAMRPTPDGPKPMPVGFGQTGEDGTFRVGQVVTGDYWVRAYVDGASNADSTAHVRYGSTFFPGVTSFEEAQPVHVAGRLLPGVDFSLVRQPTYRVAGRLIDPSGDSVAGLQVQIRSIGLTGDNSKYTATSDRAGRFALPAVGAGDYMLVVVRTTAPNQVPTSFAMRWAAVTQHLTVQATVDHLELHAQAPAHVEGRVVVDAPDGRLPDISNARVLVQHRTPGVGVFMTGFVWKAKADDTFAFDVPPAESTFEVDGLPDGWMVQRITVDGLDLGQQTAALAPAHTSHVDIVITDRVTRVSGIATARDGSPAIGASVVLFPDGPLASTLTPGRTSRWIRQTRTDRDGRFDVTGLAPGAYLAVAVDHLPYTAIEDVIVLRQLARSATSLRLGNGDQRSLGLHVMEGPRQVSATTTTAPAPMLLRRVSLQSAPPPPSAPVSQISGIVRDPLGRAVASATALLFPGDATSPSAAAAGARQARTDSAGRFTFDAVRPGSYFVIATKSPEYALRDPNLLANLSTFGTPVRVAGGERRTVSLLILPPPPPPPPAPAPPAARAPAAPAARTPAAPVAAPPSPRAVAPPPAPAQVPAPPAGAVSSGSAGAAQSFEQRRKALDEAQRQLVQLQHELAAREQQLVQQQRDLQQRQINLMQRQRDLVREIETLRHQMQDETSRAH